jgi:flagellin
MPLNSVNTNTGAMVALQSLNKTNDDMAVTQKRISTGLRVADAKDDGAAFAVAQAVRSDVAALTAANEQLGASQGLLDTTNAALKKVSDAMRDVRAVLTRLAEDDLTADQRAQYGAQYASLQKQIRSFVDDASYNGKSLLGAAPGGADDRRVVRNEKADYVTIASTDKAALVVAAAAPADAAAAKAALQAGGNFAAVEAAVNTAMNQYGNDSRTVAGQIAFNKEKVDALDSGLGALVDADLAKESAKLQALQIRQQLGTQSLGIANQSPQALLSLFR